MAPPVLAEEILADIVSQSAWNRTPPDFSANSVPVHFRADPTEGSFAFYYHRPHFDDALSASKMLASFRLVSHAWYRLATPLLYQTLWISGERNLNSLNSTLSTFVYSGKMVDTVVWDRYEICKDEAAAELLKQCTKLRCLFGISGSVLANVAPSIPTLQVLSFTATSENDLWRCCAALAAMPMLRALDIYADLLAAGSTPAPNLTRLHLPELIYLSIEGNSEALWWVMSQWSMPGVMGMCLQNTSLDYHLRPSVIHNFPTVKYLTFDCMATIAPVAPKAINYLTHLRFLSGHGIPLDPYFERLPDLREISFERDHIGAGDAFRLDVLNENLEFLSSTYRAPSLRLALLPREELPLNQTVLQKLESRGVKLERKS